jgi:hypothetical protein
MTGMAAAIKWSLRDGGPLLSNFQKCADICLGLNQARGARTDLMEALHEDRSCNRPGADCFGNFSHCRTTNEVGKRPVGTCRASFPEDGEQANITWECRTEAFMAAFDGFETVEEADLPKVIDVLNIASGGSDDYYPS